MARWIIFAFLFLGLAVTVFVISQGWNDKTAGLSNSVAAPAVSRIAVELASVTVGRMTETVRTVGTLEANESVMVRPEIAGLVKRVLFVEGQAVEKGMVLVELDDAELQANVSKAVTELRMARLTHDRMKQLEAGHNSFISQQQVDQAMSALNAAEANHAFYSIRLAKTRIRAPFSGYVGIRRISPGDYVQPAQDLVNLEDIGTLKIDFKVPERFLTRLAVGQQVEIRTDANPGEVFAGDVYAIDPRVDSSSRAIRARAHVPNADAKLRPGLFADISLILGKNDHALLIPEEAVISQRDKAFVYRVVDQTARWTEVALGGREGGLVEVLSGLSAGDSIVQAGHHKLKDGTAVFGEKTPLAH